MNFASKFAIDRLSDMTIWNPLEIPVKFPWKCGLRPFLRQQCSRQFAVRCNMLGERRPL